VQQADLIWHNGELVAWEDAKVHVLTHGLHYGTGVFEGIRAYETPHGTAIFRHRDHLQRLFNSAELYYMPIPYTLEELRSATHELITSNELRECYIRPIAFRGYGHMGLYPLDAPVEVSIAVWPWGAYLGEDSKVGGVRAKIASWRRISHDSLIPHAKASGQYLNSVLAKIEASKAGYQESILLDQQGFVSEGSGENIYLVREGQIITPPHAAGILDGISRKSINQIARDLGHEIVERDITRAELCLAAAQAGKLADNREAQAGSAVAAPATTPETFEDPSELLAAQAGTLVEHVDLDPRTLALGLDRHDGAGVGHLEGVREVVVQDLVDVAGHRLRQLDACRRQCEVHLPLLGERGPGGDAFADRGIDVQRLALRPGASRARKEEQAIHDVREALRLPNRRLQVVTSSAPGERRLQVLQPEPQGGERAAQLVGGMGGKL